MNQFLFHHLQSRLFDTHITERDVRGFDERSLVLIHLSSFQLQECSKEFSLLQNLSGNIRDEIQDMVSSEM